MDLALIGAIAVSAACTLALIGLGVEHHRYARLRSMYYRDQRKQAHQRWERDSASR